MRARSKPTEIEAIQWTGKNEDDVLAFVDGVHHQPSGAGPAFVREGGVTASVWVAHSLTRCIIAVDTWIAKEADGNGVYPIDADAFDRRWEIIE